MSSVWCVCLPVHVSPLSRIIFITRDNDDDVIWSEPVTRGVIFPCLRYLCNITANLFVWWRDSGGITTRLSMCMTHIYIYIYIYISFCTYLYCVRRPLCCYNYRVSKPLQRPGEELLVHHSTCFTRYDTAEAGKYLFLVVYVVIVYNGVIFMLLL